MSILQSLASNPAGFAPNVGAMLHLKDGASIVSLLAVLIVAIVLTRSLIYLARLCGGILIDAATATATFGWGVRRLAPDGARWRFCRSVWLNIENINEVESWQDDSFTDLEADIVASGKYFSSKVTRWIGLEATGARRVGRLYDAIASSSERQILLLGEPGSGKSVAIRHLTMQLARRAAYAKRDFRIPLYINLRGIPAASGGGPTFQTIHDYVITELGRSSELAAYVNKHWDAYIEQGRWFFIFDSFDEISDVLHAGSRSPIIRQYSEALRAFVEGKSNCKAIVASREFKGPHLAWPKFRILRLSVQRQEEMIRRSSVLSRQDAARVRQYVASTDSDAYRNPMFLTLLCQFMKDGGPAPESDYDLLHRHINKLISDGIHEVSRRWGISEDELRASAKGVARAFAWHSNLGLTPSFSDLLPHLCSSVCPEPRVRAILASLEYVKVLRSDVKVSGTDDRKFGFCHRRYQEALVVAQIVSGDLDINERMLLTDDRWREYAVTLLQSQPSHITRPLLHVAAKLIPEMAAEVADVQQQTSLGVTMHLELEESKLVQHAQLLQEGLRFRRNHVPAELESALSDVLSRFWSHGDLVNRHTVLSISGLIPQSELEARIRDVIDEPSTLMKHEAFIKAGFLGHISRDVGHWLRATLADLVIDTAQRDELRKIEVTVSWTPGSAHVGVVWRRSMYLRRMSEVIAAFASPVEWVYVGSLRFIRAMRGADEKNAFDGDASILDRRYLFKLAMLIGWMFQFVAGLFILAHYIDTRHIDWRWLSSVAILGSTTAIATWRYILRAAPVRLFSLALLGVACEWHRRNGKNYLKHAREFFRLLGISVGLFFLLRAGLRIVLGKSIDFGETAVVIYGAAVVAGGVAFFLSAVRRKRYRLRFESLSAEVAKVGNPPLALLPLARNFAEARCWLGRAEDLLLPGSTERRALSSWLLESPAVPDWRSEIKPSNLRRIAWTHAEKAVNLREVEQK
jgi:hypothetical protein